MSSRARRGLRRRWTAHITPRNGGEDQLVVFEVPDDGEGNIYVSIEETAWVFTPQQASKLRDIWLQAQAVALLDRGRW